MKSNKIIKIVYGLSMFLLSCQMANANVVVNNNNTPQGNEPQQQQPQQPNCSGGDMGTSTDPRVPPAGVYTSRNNDGSSNTLYTTGDKKPYYVDNPCSQAAANNAAANNTQPQVFVQPPVRSN